MRKGAFIPPSRRRKRRNILLGIISVFLMLAVFLAVADRRIYPLMKDFAQAQAQIMANDLINSAIEEYLRENQVTYDDLIILSREADGAVTSAQANTVGMNSIKTSVQRGVRERAGLNPEIIVKIPVGNLTGSAYLSGRGPKIKVKLILDANVYAEFESVLQSAGINQTLHMINLKVKADIHIMLPLSRTTTQFETDYLVGQTVIVGRVPDAFTSVIDQDDELDGRLMDFGATLE